MTRRARLAALALSIAAVAAGLGAAAVSCGGPADGGHASREEALRRESAGKPGYIDITHASALTQLEENAGKEVHLLATIDDVVRPARAKLAHSRHESLSLIFFDPDVLARSGIDAWRGELVVVTGAPTFYENKRRGEQQLQIVVDRASQIRLSQVPGMPVAPTASAP